ncbi:SURF1 family protein [Sphingomonas rosea]|uniref:SURF1-like protein n=1 Tax=Sphingomonas rosea TaxID=335605 RepID=A0ABP7U4V7_9SPHN
MSGRAPKRLALLTLCGLLALLFAGLGVWQVERLRWKLDLIARVDARLAAAPVAVPPSSRWPNLDAKDDEYRRVRMTGRFDDRAATQVDALTELGPGWWILTPFRTKDGTILVNRGFAPKEAVVAPAGAATVTITGLMRASELGGRFLRANRPAEERWYSRDVEAIAASRGIGPVAPFFVDAARGEGSGWPRGGMTVVRFRNAHLVYALTWFGLAALAIAGLVLVWRSRDRVT